ncbi:hypothetical protein DCO48_08325 [Pseudomonas sp. SDI]|uniref:class I SAM-dependent methyltransferase n=1 Tax=Pseudomonas sp. SDI TaxID=2170734 RepID=UPI000DE71DDD|nr:hypothetical protein DCO48_08325 [Pseudomonas sp. SDI]
MPDAHSSASTGKFTHLLQRLQPGALSAVEPVAAMRAQFASQLPEVAALAGTAQHLPLAAASVDAVLCAQAFPYQTQAYACDRLA